MITGIYAAILAFIQIKLTYDVIKVRRKQKVSIGDGGHEDLARAMRVHGNFTETVPLALILIVIAEFSGAPFWAIHALGGTLVVGRVMHKCGLASAQAPGRWRVLGMVLTLGVIIVAALLCAALGVAGFF